MLGSMASKCGIMNILYIVLFLLLSSYFYLNVIEANHGMLGSMASFNDGMISLLYIVSLVNVIITIIQKLYKQAMEC